MTLKNSYSSYFKNTLKRKSWNTALSSLLFFLTLTLPALMMIGQKASPSNTPADTLAIFNSTCENITNLMNYNGIFIKIAFILLAIIAGITAFSYLHNKAKVDFYHSFPISRRAMFLCNFAASILPVLFGFVANFILTHILVAAFGYGQALFSVGIWAAFGENLLFFLCTFSISALCTILCGNTVITLILATVAFFGQGVIYVLTCAIKGVMYSTYYLNAQEMFETAFKLSPVTQIFNSFGWQNATSRCLTAIVYLVVTAIVIAIAFFCYLKRKSEHSGIAIAFNRFKLPLKLYCCIIFGLGFAFIFCSFVEQTVWIYFGAIFGILLAHAISEITFDFSFSSIFKHWKHGAILLAVSLCILAGMNFDITGFNTRTVKASDVKSFDFRLLTGNSSSHILGDATLSSPENIEAITEIIEKASTFEFVKAASCVEVAVKKAPFGTFKRSLPFELTEENAALFNTIRYSDEYKRETSALFCSNIKKSNEVIIEFGALKSSADSMLLTGDKITNILAAMQEDYLNLTIEDGFNVAPLYMASFQNNDKNVAYRDESFPIYKSYTKTLALLEEYGDLPKDKLTVDNIDKIEIYQSSIDYFTRKASGVEDLDANSDWKQTTEKDTLITFTDKAEIEKLIENAVYTGFSRHMDRLMDYEEVGVNIYFKGETEPQDYVIDSKNFLAVAG